MKWLHIHCTTDLIRVSNYLSGFKWVYLESILIHLSYHNVQLKFNNIFYVESTTFITLTPGYYDLTTLNDILKTANGGYYKLLLSQGCQYYELRWFATLADWNANNITASTDITPNVKDKSELNKQIYNMTFFNGIRVKISNIIEDYSFGEQNTTELESSTDIEIPITSKAGQQQYIYFTDRPYILSETSNFFVWFYDWNGNQIKNFTHLNEPIIDLIADEIFK